VDVLSLTRGACWRLTCALVCVSIALSLTLNHGYFLTAFGDISQCAALFLLLLCLLANVRTTARRIRLFWSLLACGGAVWLAAQLLWTWFEVVLRQDVPNPFIGDVVLFLHLVPMMGAMAVRPHVEEDEQITRLGGVDFALLMVWWLYLFLFVVIPWQYVSPDSDLYGSSFDRVYFLEHFVFLVSVGSVWARTRGPWKAIYGQLFGASLVYASGSVAASIAIDFGRYYTGSLYDIPLLVSMAWFVRCALVGRTLPHAEIRHERSAVRRAWLSGLAMATIFTMPVLAGWSVYVSNAPSPVRSFRLQLTLGCLMLTGALTWIKQHRLHKELARANRELREDSLTDLLTGIRNRRFFTSTVQADVQQALRSYSPRSGAANQRNRDLAFYLIDSDSFKEVNDRYGHDVGDRLLVETARRISSAIRHSDVLIRWGGDEFMVVSRYTDRDEASTLAARVLHAVGGETFRLENGTALVCTCSIGWAVFPWFVHAPEAVGYEDVLRLADSALYDVKKAGKNQAIGMLPTRLEPCAPHSSDLAGKDYRLAEKLAARTVAVLGPQALPFTAQAPLSTEAAAPSI